MFKSVKRLFLLSVVTLVLLGAVQSSDNPSPSDVAVSPYKYSLFRWEVDHFLDKWVNKVQEVLPWNSEPSREASIAQAQEFFDLTAEIRELEFESADDNAARIDELRQRRSDMQTDVEETVESEISAILVEEGFSSRIGVIFPPVDTVFAASPGALIISPRDRIAQISSTLLKPGIPGDVRNELEETIFREDDVSALVVSVPVATIPRATSSREGCCVVRTTFTSSSTTNRRSGRPTTTSATSR